MTSTKFFALLLAQVQPQDSVLSKCLIYSFHLNKAAHWHCILPYIIAVTFYGFYIYIYIIYIIHIIFYIYIHYATEGRLGPFQRLLPGAAEQSLPCRAPAELKAPAPSSQTWPFCKGMASRIPWGCERFQPMCSCQQQDYSLFDYLVLLFYLAALFES